MENENESRKPSDMRYRYGMSFRIVKVIKVILMVALFGTIMTYVVMMLWNWLMPMIFNLSVINFWQAAGILILTKIFFGFSHGWGGGHRWGRHHYYWKEKMEERLKNMTPEDRERFRAQWKQRCGGWKHYDWGEEKKTEENIKM